ncbi:MAG: polyprenyl diphosphate synthase [Planctomycetota bacterium]
MSGPATDTDLTGAASPFADCPEAIAAVRAMRSVNPSADPLGMLPDVHPTRIPRHIAIIMDGNGRWARDKGFPRTFGHRNGAASVRRAVREAGLCGVECVTLYSFSTENWKRPADEIEALMQLCQAYCEGQKDELVDEGVRVRVIGSREGLPEGVLGALDELVAATNAGPVRGPTLCLAINYGAREELVEAARRLASDAAAGRILPESIDAAALESRLTTAGLPDPDLLIRTAGEMRLSNYLLWQISYAELYVCDTLWPDFDQQCLHTAIRAYAQRDRRFGGLGASGAAEADTAGAADDERA